MSQAETATLSPAELRAWRHAWGWNREAAGMHLNYAASSIGGYERGEHPIPADVVAYVRAHPAPAPLTNGKRPYHRGWHGR